MSKTSRDFEAEVKTLAETLGYDPALGGDPRYGSWWVGPAARLFRSAYPEIEVIRSRANCEVIENILRHRGLRYWYVEQGSGYRLMIIEPSAEARQTLAELAESLEEFPVLDEETYEKHLQEARVAKWIGMSRDERRALIDHARAHGALTDRRSVRARLPSHEITPYITLD